MTKTSRSDLSTTNVLMPIAARAQVELAIVQMPCLDRPHADGRIDFRDHRFVARGAANIVAGGENMTCVDAHAGTRRLLQAANHLVKLPECASKRSALPRGGFQQRRYP